MARFRKKNQFVQGVVGHRFGLLASEGQHALGKRQLANLEQLKTTACALLPQLHPRRYY